MYPEIEYKEKLFQDIRWLIADGYITHFSDDSLIAQPLDEKSSEVNDSKDQPKAEKQMAASMEETLNPQKRAPEMVSAEELGRLQMNHWCQFRRGGRQYRLKRRERKMLLQDLKPMLLPTKKAMNG